MVNELQGRGSEPRGRQLMDTTVARSIMYGASAAPVISVLTYGMGWMRMTYLGHEVSTQSVPKGRAAHNLSSLTSLLARVPLGIYSRLQSFGISPP